MNPVLKRLGISPEVQAFFHADELRFDHGGISEVFSDELHYVPTTAGIWLAGNRYAPEVIVTCSAMEAIAWYAHHRSRYADPAALAVLSLGNLPSPEQLSWVRSAFKQRKFTLVFGECLLGKLTDIKVACMFKGKTVSLVWQKKKAIINFEGRTAELQEACCSLHHFQKRFGLRLGIRTSKPALHTTFLDQLQYDMETGIRLRPAVSYTLWKAALLMGSSLVAPIPAWTLLPAFILVSLFLMMAALYRILYIRHRRYKMTDEFIRLPEGLFFRRTDVLELYRIRITCRPVHC